MTREEAITQLELLLEYCESMMTSEYPVWRRDCEALQMLIAALRPVSREKVEKVWRGCPECNPRCGLCVHMGQWDKYGKPYVCEKCVGFSNFESDQKFCECCGRPLTDDAVQMVMERMEAFYD